MTIIDPSESPPLSRYMGLDVGARRVGVAVSSPNAGFALPVETVDVRHARVGAQRIVGLMRERAITHVVVGWPLNLEGKTGRATQRVEKFVRELEFQMKRVLEQPDEVIIIQWDERLTTTAAESFLISEDVSRSRRKEVVDQVAATHILNSFLSSLPRSS